MATDISIQWNGMLGSQKRIFRMLAEAKRITDNRFKCKILLTNEKHQVWIVPLKGFNPAEMACWVTVCLQKFGQMRGIVELIQYG